MIQNRRKTNKFPCELYLFLQPMQNLAEPANSLSKLKTKTEDKGK